MKISQLIKELRQQQALFGDIPVCIAQLKGRTVRLTGVHETYMQHGVAYVTNMTPDEIAATVDK